MALFSGSIFIEYEAALAQADRLEQCAEEADRASKSIDVLLGDLAGSWQGDNSTLFAQKCRELQGKINQTASDLRNTASAVQTVARKLKEADQEAAAIASSNGSGGGGGGSW